MVKRLDLGMRPSGSYGIRHSIPGVDVDSATPDQFIFNSDWGASGLVHAYGTAATLSAVPTFPALGYIPMAQVFMLDAAGNIITTAATTYNGVVAGKWVRVFAPVWDVTDGTIRRMDVSSPDKPWRWFILKLPGL